MEVTNGPVSTNIKPIKRSTSPFERRQYDRVVKKNKASAEKVDHDKFFGISAKHGERAPEPVQSPEGRGYSILKVAASVVIGLSVTSWALLSPPPAASQVKGKKPAIAAIAGNYNDNDATKVKTPDAANGKPPEATKVPEFKTELKDGIIHFPTRTLDIKESLKKITGSDNLSEKDVLRKIETPLGGVPGFYYVFKNAVLRVSVGDDRDKVGGTGIIGEIFTHEGAIFIAKDGSLVASSPSSILVMTPTEITNAPYRSLFGDVPMLVKPRISGGRDDNHVDIRDEVITDGVNRLKIVVELSPKISGEVVPDLLALGSR